MTQAVYAVRVPMWLVAALILTMPSWAAADTLPRSVLLAYYVEVPPQHAAKGMLEIFIPIIVSDDQQQVLSRDIVTVIPGTLEHNKKTGRLFWHGRTSARRRTPAKVQVNYVLRDRGYGGDELLSPVFEYRPECLELRVRHGGRPSPSPFGLVAEAEPPAPMTLPVPALAQCAQATPSLIPPGHGGAYNLLSKDDNGWEAIYPRVELAGKTVDHVKARFYVREVPSTVMAGRD